MGVPLINLNIMPHTIELQDLDGWKAEVIFASSTKEHKKLVIVSYCNWNSIDSHYDIRINDKTITQTNKLDKAIEAYNSIV